MSAQGGQDAWPPPPPNESGKAPTNVRSRKSGCSAVFAVLFFIAGISLVRVSSGFSTSCSNYPEDGYCSLQQMVRGAGWVLVGAAVLALVVPALIELSRKKNGR